MLFCFALITMNPTHQTGSNVSDITGGSLVLFSRCYKAPIFSLFPFVAITVKEKFPWISRPLTESCVQVVALMNRKAGRRSSSSRTAIVDVAAAALEDLQTQQVRRVMRASLAFSPYYHKETRIREYFRASSSISRCGWCWQGRTDPAVGAGR